MGGAGRGYVALSVGLSGLGVVHAVGSGAGPAHAAAVLLGTLGVLLAPTAPVALAALAALSTAAQVALDAGVPTFASFLVLLVATYALGRACDLPRLLTGLALLVAPIVLMVAADPSLQRPVEIVFPVVYLGGGVGVGRLARSRERAAQAAVAAVAAAAASREHEALAEERARIAREMHDVVAHSVSLLVVQAESAAAVLDRDPERARAQLERISASGRQALEELRRLLGLLQAGGEQDGTHPQPALADLPGLREAVQATGARVELHVDEDAGAAPPGVQLTAYRVVQEALTNAVRHGRATSVQVNVRRQGDVLSVDVVDDGTAPPSGSAPGHGLQGMRERVGLYDGELEAGPRSDGGFRVAARLPVAP